MPRPHGARIIALTGANSGIGLALAKMYLDAGETLLAIARKPGDHPAFVAARSTGKLRDYNADLADFAQLKKMIFDIKSQEPEIDLLINNAGLGTADLAFSPQGREMTFEVNSVVPYILTKQLVPQLARTAGRVVNVSSGAARHVRQFEPRKLANPATHRRLTGSYAQSKLALSLWTAGLADELAAQGIEIVSVDPGANQTPLTMGSAMPWPLRILARYGLIFGDPMNGARRIAEAAENCEVSGSFLVNGSPSALPHGGAVEDVLSLVNHIYREGFD